MKNLLILFAFILCTCISCNIENQFTRAHDKLDNSTNPAKKAIPAGHCATWYPPVQSTKEVVKFTPGNADTVKGERVYVYANCDSAVKAGLDEAAMSHVEIQCPPQQFITLTDTLEDTVTTIVENTARVTAQVYQIQAIGVQADKYKGQASFWRKWCLITWGILLLLLILIIAWKYLKSKV